MASEKLDFNCLVRQIKEIHETLLTQATKAVNMGLTLRNWLIGMHIVEYELKGTDRAVYGDRLIFDLSKQLATAGVSNCNRRQLYHYLAFYRAYPQIVGALPPQIKSLSAINLDAQNIVGAAPPQFQLSAETLTGKLSYTHLEMLVDIEDSLKRYFYEVECIRGGWSVRELKRQIASLYYERSGLSKDKKKLSELTLDTSEKQQPRQLIRDPYVFEFLGIKPKEVMSESDLEDALLDKLQEFLLELGHGFCFEARQKTNFDRRRVVFCGPGFLPS